MRLLKLNIHIVMHIYKIKYVLCCVVCTDGTPVEKVASQRIRLASEFLASYTRSDSPPTTINTAFSQWQQLIDQVIDPAAKDTSPVIRSAALCVLAVPGREVHDGWDHETETHALQVMSIAASRDEASAVRASACKSLAAALSLESVVMHPRFGMFFYV